MVLDRRFNREALQNVYEALVIDPPRFTPRRGQNYSGHFTHRFWTGYNGITIRSCMGEPDTVARAAYEAGRKRRALEESGDIPPLTHS